MTNKKIKGGESNCMNKKNGIAANVPKVPGAFFINPLPKPRAKKAEKFLNSNLFGFKMIIAFLFEFIEDTFMVANV